MISISSITHLIKEDLNEDRIINKIKEIDNSIELKKVTIRKSWSKDKK